MNLQWSLVPGIHMTMLWNVREGCWQQNILMGGDVLKFCYDRLLEKCFSIPWWCRNCSGWAIVVFWVQPCNSVQRSDNKCQWFPGRRSDVASLVPVGMELDRQKTRMDGNWMDVELRSQMVWSYEGVSCAGIWMNECVEERLFFMRKINPLLRLCKVLVNICFFLGSQPGVNMDLSCSALAVLAFIAA